MICSCQIYVSEILVEHRHSLNTGKTLVNHVWRNRWISNPQFLITVCSRSNIVDSSPSLSLVADNIGPLYLDLRFQKQKERGSKKHVDPAIYAPSKATLIRRVSIASLFFISITTFFLTSNCFILVSPSFFVSPLLFLLTKTSPFLFLISEKRTLNTFLLFPFPSYTFISPLHTYIVFITFICFNILIN